MFKEVVTFLALVAVAFGYGVQKRSYGCGALLQCIEELEEMELTEVESLTEEDILDHVCDALDGVKSCIRNAGSSCHDLTSSQEARAVLDVAEYLCTEEGKQVVLDLAESPCATDELKQLEVQVSMHACLENFEAEVQSFVMNAYSSGQQLDTSDMCPFVDSLKACMRNQAAQRCGEAFGSFVEKIWEISAGDQFAQLGCTSEVTVYRRMITQTLPAVLKRTAAIVNRRK